MKGRGTVPEEDCPPPGPRSYNAVPVTDLPEGIEPAEAAEPRESAAGIVVRDGEDGRLEVLVGQRSSRASFLPGNLAFPGGRLEGRDRPDRGGAHARCVSREVEEETGVRVEPGRWLDCGERVTPPLFPVRFRTRFFLAEAPAGATIPPVPPSPEENERVVFEPPAEILRAWEEGAALVPPPVLPVLRALVGAKAASLVELAGALREVNTREQRTPRIEFVPGIWAFPLASRTLPPATHTNVWMPGGEAFVIVDPGSASDAEIDRLLAVVARREELGHRAVAVVLTHHHGDHAAGAAKVARVLGLPVCAHRATLDRLGLAEARVGAVPIEDGQRLDLEGLSLRAVATPGHAPGHLAFHVPERRAVIAGDLVSGVSTILIDPVEGDMDAYLDSVRRVQALDCRLVLPGHGPPLPPRALTDLIAHRLERERRVLAALERGLRSLADIASLAYDDAPTLPLFLRARQALAHLIALERRGAVRRSDPEGRAWAAVE